MRSSCVKEILRLRGSRLVTQDDTLSYDTNIMENTMTNSATVSPTPSTIR
jgi:hypothetical protein